MFRVLNFDIQTRKHTNTKVNDEFNVCYGFPFHIHESRHEHGSVWCGFESKPHRNHIYSVSKIKNQNQTIHKWCGSVF